MTSYFEFNVFRNRKKQKKAKEGDWESNMTWNVTKEDAIWLLVQTAKQYAIIRTILLFVINSSQKETRMNDNDNIYMNINVLFFHSLH